NMLPVLAGKSTTATHQSLCWDFPGFGSAVTDGNLKLVVPKNAKPQLFDLATDTGEKNDLAEQRPDDVKRLNGLLVKWQAQNVTPLWGPNSKAATPQVKPQSDREKLFTRRDKNKDGALTKEEFMAVQADKSEGEKRFTRLDKNGDGVLNLEEFANTGK
ncbi:MAG TPA: hypothetical protein VF258_02615, partial [Luteolibacter sp.]